MGIKGTVSKFIADIIARDIKFWRSHPVETQQEELEELLRKGRKTAFGKEHGLDKVNSYEEFKKAIPLRDYEQLKPWINRVVDGEEDVLWPGKPIYFAKTSGTTSGTKYIPITKDSISNHIDSARNALLMFVHETRNGSFFDGNLIFLSGSPVLEEKNGIKTGRLSGIVNHHIPAVLKKNQLPSYQTNCIEDWEEKLERIIDETIGRDLRLISGIPPWVQMYFDRLQERTGKTICEVFPNLQLLVHGGVNFEPYRGRLEQSLGKTLPTIETYPASEGFIAFQDTQTEPGLLLILNKGIFYEFVPANEMHEENPTRLSLGEVEIGVNYAIILHTNAGLWGYVIGDTVKFVSKDPYRVIVSGRIKHYISAFGEHVIGEEVDEAISAAAAMIGVSVNEFHVAPQVTPPEGGEPYHEWFVEFSEEPENLTKFALEIDKNLRHKNVYYDDLISGNILQPLKIRAVHKGGFNDYMRSKGRLGGQNKLPRLANDRNVADELKKHVKE